MRCGHTCLGHHGRLKQAIRKANVKWFSERMKRRRARASPQQIVSLRLADFAKLLRSRYSGTVLPDDDAGRDDIEPVIHHLAALTHPARRAAHWLELWAPWLTLAETNTIITTAIANARPWTADQLAWRYRVTKEERTMLGLTTIGAIDQGKAARTKRRKERDRARKRAKRQAAGATPRTTYEAHSLEHTKPWLAEGMSRAKWYRKRHRETETGPATA